MTAYLRLLAAMLMALGAECAWAQAPSPVSEAAKATAGSWEFSNADRDKLCMVNLKAEAGSVGMKLEFDQACAKVFPFVREIAAWTVAENDFLRLLDARGRPVLEFSEVEGGLYEAPRPGEGILFLQTAAAAGPAPRTADQMMGDWGIVRGSGKAVCVLTLSNNPAGTDVFALRIKPGCDRAVAQFAPTTWRMDRGELVLVAPRGSWRFEEEEAGTWHRIPETAERLLIVKQ
jgi:Protease inhibitor Inh